MANGYYFWKRIGTETDIMKKTAIIFDHDGTLVDSIDAVIFCTNRVIENAGFKPDPVEKVKHGMAYPTAQRFGFHTDITDPLTLDQMSIEFYDLMNVEGIQHLKLYPGIESGFFQARAGVNLDDVWLSSGVDARVHSTVIQPYSFQSLYGFCF